MHGIMKSNRWLLVGALLLLLAACWPARAAGDDDEASGADAAAPAEGSSAAAPAESGEAGGGGKLTLVAYSTPKEAYEAVIPAFQATPAGQGATFDQSYGASGDQSRAIVSGLPADIAAFSLEPDMTRLTDEGLVDAGWNAGPTKGMVTDSVVVFLVRKGNPKGIKTWDDLVKPGVEVINPNPFVSGGARWNVMAGYGAQIKQGKTEEQAVEYLDKLFHQIVVQPKSARDGLNAFVEGKGDVLLGLRERGHHRAAEGRGRRLRHPRRDDPDREPDRRRQHVRERGHRQGVRRLRAQPRGPEALRREGLPAGRPDGAAGVRRHVPDAERPLHHRRRRRLAGGHGEVLRQGHRHRRGDQQEPRSAPRGLTQGRQWPAHPSP